MINKKAQTEILTWIVIALTVALFLGLWVYGHGLLTDALTSIGVQSGTNISEAAESTFGQMNDAMANGVAILGFVILFATALSILINNYFIREHPAVLIIHILVTLLAVVVSVYVSNTYANLLTGQPFSSNLIAMKAVSYIMLHLPTWVTVIGIFGAIILAIRIIRTRDEFV